MRFTGIMLALLLGCGEASQPDLRRYFDAYSAEGTFVLRNGATSEQVIHDEARADTRFIPASTFKILNSLIALELGVITLDDTVEWDGIARGNPTWDQSQSMRDAFQRSTVWFYQALARRIGAARMGAALAREQYGNQDIGGGIDRFWLDGQLRISALEQVDLLERLHDRELGFSLPVMQQVEDLLLMERCADYVLRGKTGWAESGGNQLGWLVGWVERGDDTYYFAMNLENPDPEFPMIEARQRVTRGILADLGIIPAGCEPT